MNKSIRMFAFFSIAAFLLGCASARGPVRGGTIQVADGGISASASIEHSKKGEASCISILGMIGTGDCSIRAAANNGGIKDITHVDSETLSVLGFFASFRTVVYGN